MAWPRQRLDPNLPRRFSLLAWHAPNCFTFGSCRSFLASLAIWGSGRTQSRMHVRGCVGQLEARILPCKPISPPFRLL
ncbi:hypothetical protein BCR44DRAFT_1437826 [Catenaria anguillulae PL171]|uniref:Uncharacterized protein n=1 Tax=Catenaria anguillulae PL171 TaxID=765915 RepID=A0A1Y2HG97_9FUNG|nr:hypothetical protein BCR44DRAFT_1437826 [Catenaria anguillulae PL171]